jgi:hypothetical protein
MTDQYPCPDVLFSSSLQVDATPQPIAEPSREGMAFWLLMLTVAIALVITEGFALKHKRPTDTQNLQRGPRWLRWSVGAALVFVIWHLFVQE